MSREIWKSRLARCPGCRFGGQAFPHFQKMINPNPTICNHSGHESASFDRRGDDRIASELSLICICTLIWRTCSFADALNAHFWSIWFFLLFQPILTEIWIILTFRIHSGYSQIRFHMQTLSILNFLIFHLAPVKSLEIFIGLWDELKIVTESTSHQINHCTFLLSPLHTSFSCSFCILAKIHTVTVRCAR